MLLIQEIIFNKIIAKINASLSGTLESVLHKDFLSAQLRLKDVEAFIDNFKSWYVSFEQLSNLLMAVNFYVEPISDKFFSEFKETQTSGFGKLKTSQLLLLAMLKTVFMLASHISEKQFQNNVFKI